MGMSSSHENLGILVYYHIVYLDHYRKQIRTYVELLLS